MSCGDSVSRPVVVAELGCNHAGSMETAKKMIATAAECGAAYAKFQKRDLESIPPEIAARPRTDDHAFGATELEHRRALEFTIEQHAELKTYAEGCGIKYACSAWDEKSAREVVSLGGDYLKIPSAKNAEWLGWDIPYVAGGRPVHLHVSFGMTTATERAELVGGPTVCIVPYACTSSYPCENSDVFLLEIPRLRRHWDVVGFSGHHRGIQLDIAAYALGATWFERHFTLDRTSKGTDHAASLEPRGLATLVRDLAAVHSAMKHKPADLPECEVAVRKKLKGF